MCMLEPLGEVATLAKKVYASPSGKAFLLAAAPFVLLLAALATGVTDVSTVIQKATCIADCDCARSYAIGAALVWMLGIQSVWRGAGGTRLPAKSEQSTTPPVLFDAKGKVAAKAA